MYSPVSRTPAYTDWLFVCLPACSGGLGRPCLRRTLACLPSHSLDDQRLVERDEQVGGHGAQAQVDEVNLRAPIRSGAQHSAAKERGGEGRGGDGRNRRRHFKAP